MIELALMFVAGFAGSLCGAVVAGEVAYKVFSRKRDRHWRRVD